MHNMKSTQSDAEKKYQHFDKIRRRIITALIYTLIVLVVFVIIGFKVVDSTYIPLLIAVSLLAIFSFITFLICRKLASTHTTLYFEAYGNSTDLIKTGIFKELWDEYDDNQFEGLFDSKTKIKFMETHNNIIDIIVIRNHHEIAIEINQKTIDLIVDEESDSPIYHSIEMNSISSIDVFSECINDFISIHTS